MDYSAETYFVESYIKKDRQKRMLYELTTPKSVMRDWNASVITAASSSITTRSFWKAMIWKDSRSSLTSLRSTVKTV